MENTKKTGIIRSVYLYLVTAIAIVVLLISVIGSLNIVIREYVFGVHGSWDNLSYPMEIKGGECSEDALFYSYDNSGKKYLIDTSLTAEQKKTKTDECVKKVEERNKLQNDNQIKRDFAQYLAMFLVAFPLYLYHWSIIRKEAKK
ncbi:hypothetical protein M0P48_00670 [Candidatus Gracilibacteria bacterium]|jgi:hypothetical protein|nr:hypothetical protein [Candidatus Gracilibacteria bacterium]